MKPTCLLLLLLAVGCGGPDTLHYRVRDPQLVTVLVDGKPSIPPATPGEPTATDPTTYELPVGASPHRSQDDVVFDVVPRLAYWSSRHHGGYTSHVGSDVQPGEHVITLSTPRSNLIAAEQRGDRDRVIFGLATAGISLDVDAIYELVRGTRKRTLHP